MMEDTEQEKIMSTKPITIAIPRQPENYNCPSILKLRDGGWMISCFVLYILGDSIKLGRWAPVSVGSIIAERRWLDEYTEGVVNVTSALTTMNILDLVNSDDKGYNIIGEPFLDILDEALSKMG
jgi:hypothetical protein